MNIRTTARTLILTGTIVFAATTSAMADRGRGSDDGSPRQEDRRQDRRDDSCSNSNSGKSGGSASNAAKQRLRLIGRVGSDNNGGVKTVVKYEARGNAASTSNRRFDVEVEGLTPGATLNVTIKGVKVATITANSFGVAKLELRPSPDDSNEQPIPGSFPRLTAGSVVTVGSVNVTLRTR